MTRLEDGANSRQVGGDHYKSSFQHWDWVERTGMGYLEAQATRYMRWRKKNGLEDLQKALHYTEKLMEEIKLHERPNKIPVKFHAGFRTETLEYCRANEYSVTEIAVHLAFISWRDLDDVVFIRALIQAMIDGVEGKNPEPPF